MGGGWWWWGEWLGGGGVSVGGPPPPPPTEQKSGVAEPKPTSPAPARFGAEPKNAFMNVFDNTYDIGDFRAHYAREYLRWPS